MDNIQAFLSASKTFLETISILGTVVAALGAWWSHRNRPRRSPGRQPPIKAGRVNLEKPDLIDYAWSGIAIIFLLSFIAIYVIGEYFPAFVITSPHDGDSIVSDLSEISVSGIGARRGETIVVYVSDGHTSFEQTGKGTSSDNGNWVVNNVVLQTTGYQYSIWAETQRNSVRVSTDNRVNTTRVDKSQWFPAGVSNFIRYLPLPLVIGVAFAILVLLTRAPHPKA